MNKVDTVVNPHVTDFRINVFFASTCFILLPSYVLHSFLNIDSRVLFALTTTICTVILIRKNRLKIEGDVLTVLFIAFALGLVASALSGKASQILMIVCLMMNVLVATCGWQYFIHKSVLQYLYYVCLILVAGSILGSLYAFGGGMPVHSIVLRDGGRELFLYLTTYTDSISGNIIRPAGIFDEAGALAMLICGVVSLNEALRGSKKWSYILLVCGLVSGSFVLLAVLILYMIYERTIWKSWFVVGLGLVSVLLLYSDNFSQFMDNLFFSRIGAIEIVDGSIVGDNRSVQISEFFEIVNLDITLKGAEDKTQALDQSSNPFSIYYAYGIFVWLIYLTLECWLLYCSFYYRAHLRFPAMTMFLILLQRPYLYSLYWGMMIVVICYTIFRLQKSKFLDDLLYNERHESSAN